MMLMGTAAQAMEMRSHSVSSRALRSTWAGAMCSPRCRFIVRFQSVNRPPTGGARSTNSSGGIVRPPPAIDGRGRPWRIMRRHFS